MLGINAVRKILSERAYYVFHCCHNIKQGIRRVEQFLADDELKQNNPCREYVCCSRVLKSCWLCCGMRFISLLADVMHTCAYLGCYVALRSYILTCFGGWDPSSITKSAYPNFNAGEDGLIFLALVHCDKAIGLPCL